MDGQTVLWLNLIIGGAALMSSMTGFGFALIGTPFLCLVLPPKIAVPVVLLSWLPLSLILVLESYRYATLRRVGKLLAVGVVGIPVGAYGLAHSDPGFMKAVIGCITLLAALLLWRKPARLLGQGRVSMLAAGLVSGIMGGASGMSGPPIVLLGLSQSWEHRGFRADLIHYFAIMYLVTLALFRNFGMLEVAVFKMAGWAFPGLLVGAFIGLRLKARISQDHFRRLAFALVCAGGILAIVLH